MFVIERIDAKWWQITYMALSIKTIWKYKPFTTTTIPLKCRGAPAHAPWHHPPPKIGKNMMFWHKIVIFHTKYPNKICTSLRSGSIFLSAPPPNLKCLRRSHKTGCWWRTKALIRHKQSVLMFINKMVKTSFTRH